MKYDGNDRSRVTATNPLEAAAEMGAYSGRDLDLFERLSGFSSFRGSAVEGTRLLEGGPKDASALDYSDADTLAFARLTEALDRLPRTLGAALGVQGGSAHAPYTDRDHQHFSRLTPPDRGFEAEASGAQKPAGPSSDPEEAVTYEPSDIEAFRRLMPDAVSQPGAAVSDRSPRSAERDVGPIRVVDFGGQRKRPNSRGRTGDVTIKVRYFD